MKKLLRGIAFGTIAGVSGPAFALVGYAGEVVECRDR